MSIILKALKKAEESKSQKQTIVKSQTYSLKEKKMLFFLAGGFITAVFVFSVGIYYYKYKLVPVSSIKTVKRDISLDKKTDIKAEENKAVQKKEQEDTANAPDAAKLHADAIQEIKRKNYALAEELLRKALAIMPDNSAMHNHLGLALRRQLRFKEASEEYEKALKLKPDYYEAMNNLAVTYEMLGNTEKAKSMYKKALSVNPTYVEAHLNYALLLEAERDYSNAESHYHTFLNLSSDASLKERVRERLKMLRK